MPVVGRALLIAVGRADTRIHVENNCPRRLAAMNAVDPPTGEIGKRGKVLLACQPLRLEPAHLAGGGGTVVNRPAADNPTHRRIARQPVRIVHILVASEPPKHGLTQQAGQDVPRVLAATAV